MTAERWQRVKAIFYSAKDVAPAARAEFLRSQCGADDELRREVESLLASDEDGNSLLDRPMVEEGAMAAAAQVQGPEIRRKVTDPQPEKLVLNGRYEVERELGRGGMSVVYLAQDRQLLSKRVVIKVLLDETSQDPWIRRKFLQEMEALARIDHPGVVGVLDTGLTVEGQRYLVMQYIEGATLRSVIRQGGMEAVRAAGLVRQIGQALAAVHDKGVWHRDLKPENIMLQCLGGEDHVKLIDFGIAGIQDSQFKGENTKVAGSLSYMAPEQLTGNPCAASDTYALGVVAYEILTGERPSPMSEPRTALPQGAESPIRKALSVRPEARQSSARDFSEELYQALTSGIRRTTAAETAEIPPVGKISSPKARLKVLFASTAALVLLASSGAIWIARGSKGLHSVQEAPSIAVLPFVDRSPEKDQEYFSDGVSEQLLNSLARVEGLRVVGRTSSFRFKDSTDDSREIGKKLNVTAILEGSVSRQGTRARINVQLIKTADGFNLWSNTYDRQVSDIFEVQDSIARAVTEALKVTLMGKKGTDRATPGTSAEAYNAYLQGRYFSRRNDKESLERATAYFEQAIKADQGYAPAWVGLAEAHTNQSNLGYQPTDAGYQKARIEIDKALALDANLGEAYAALGRVKMLHDWDWAGADAAYQRALALEPGKSSVISQSGNLARILGRFDEAAALGRRATQIDPLIPGAYHNAGIALYYAGLYDQATAAFRKALELVPEREITHSMLAAVCLVKGQTREALVEARQEKNAALQLWGLALAYHALGDTNESAAKLAELIAKFRSDGPFVIAEVYAYQGDANHAFEWLERAYAERDSGLTLIKGNPLLKRVEHDPRFASLLKKLGLPS